MNDSSLAKTSGAFLRRVILKVEPGRVLAGLEDDFHHFVLTLTHLDEQVTGLALEARRTPWSACGDASSLLQGLVGTALSAHGPSAPPDADAKQQCTHQYDLALLACSHALCIGCWDYQLTVFDPDTQAQQTARLELNGQTLLNWQLQGSRVIDGLLLAGQDLRNISTEALQPLDDQERVALSMLRRAVMVSRGRGVRLEQFTHASELLPRMAGACYVYQPAHADHASRNDGSVRRDLQSHAQLLTGLGFKQTEESHHPIS